MLATTRLIRRSGVLLGGAAAALLHFAALCIRRRGIPPLRERARWLHEWCAWAVPKLGIRLRAAREARGLYVANHLSYLDILVLSALSPAVFVAKREVRGWPVFGLMARLAGTIFLERGRLRELPRAIRHMEAALAAGVPVVLFPEGTTTDGSSVLAFRSALFQPAVNLQAPITPAALSYSLEEGDAAREVCWWGEMTLLPHLVALLGKRRIHAAAEFCSAPHVWRNRKLAAILTREQITVMLEALPAQPPGGTRPAPQATLEAAAGARLG
jgi:1-acyl-sn-glycerol-3-phosphate acyltransferase